ncbi:MAG: LysM peptidoglycan-binding domain-containing protein [Chloroflexota bacterium]
MRTRSPWMGVLAATLIAAALILAACVPDPSNRPRPSGGDAQATPTPIPTPAGPTPTPSFVRPTPTPQPTFFAYTVVSGDSLGAIAKRFKTSGRSIAYWNRVTYPSLDPDSGAYRPDYLKVGWLLLLIPNAEVDPENLPSSPPAGAIDAPAAPAPERPPAI